MEEALFYNALNIKYKTNQKKLAQLKSIFGTWKNAWIKEPKDHTSLDPEKEWAKLEELGIKLILENEPQYPHLLKEIPAAPLGIYYLGNLPSNNPSARGVSSLETQPS